MIASDWAQAIEPGRSPIHQRASTVNPGALTPMWCSTVDSDARVEIATHESSYQRSTVPVRARATLTTTANAIVSAIARPAHRSPARLRSPEGGADTRVTIRREWSTAAGVAT